MRGKKIVVKRLVAGYAAVALCLLGCSSGVDSSTVQLATGAGEFPVDPDGHSECVTYYNVGTLIADPENGTAAEGVGGRPDGEFGIRPLIWPLGYTAHRLAGGEIEVLDLTGEIVATTGQIYKFWTGSWGTAGSNERGTPVHTGGPGCVTS